MPKSVQNPRFFSLFAKKRHNNMHKTDKKRNFDKTIHIETMKIKHFLAKAMLYAVVVSAALAHGGCNKEESTGMEIRIAPRIETRVSGINFENGDQIGLTVALTGRNHVANQLLTYNGSTFGASGLIWYNNLNETSTLRAYYPYNSNGEPTSFAVLPDQSRGCESSDLLAAVQGGIQPSGSAIAMTFKHLMTKLLINIDNQSSASVSKITVDGALGNATVDFTNLTATATGSSKPTVTVHQITADAAYEVIVVPQTASLTVTVYTDDGKSRSQTTAAHKLEGGSSYNINATVTNIDLSLSISGKIEDWNNGGDLTTEEGTTNSGSGSGGGNGSESGSGSGSATETISWQNETYKTATIGSKTWMAENMRHIPSGATIGTDIWYSNGTASTAATKGLLYSYAVATAGETAEPMQGICPDGWHLPSKAELETLTTATLPDGFLIYDSGVFVGTTNKHSTVKCTVWSSTAEGVSNAYRFEAKSGETPTVKSASAYDGCSVRCVKN